MLDRQTPNNLLNKSSGERKRLAIWNLSAKPLWSVVSRRKQKPEFSIFRYLIPWSCLSAPNLTEENRASKKAFHSLNPSILLACLQTMVVER